MNEFMKLKDVNNQFPPSRETIIVEFQTKNTLCIVYLSHDIFPRVALYVLLKTQFWVRYRAPEVRKEPHKTRCTPTVAHVERVGKIWNYNLDQRASTNACR